MATNPKPTATVMLVTPGLNDGQKQLEYGRCTSIRYHLNAGSPILEFTDNSGQRHVTSVPWQLTWDDNGGR